MRISRQGLCCVGLFLGMLSAPALAQPRLFMVREGEDPSVYSSGPAEDSNENSVLHEGERGNHGNDNGIQSDGDFRLFFVPAGDDPRDYAGGPTIFNASALRGRFVKFEIFIEHAPVPVRNIAAGLACTAAGGASGSIDFVVGTARHDAFRADYVFFQALISCFPDQLRCPDDVLRFACGLGSSGTVDVSEPRYYAEFELYIGLDAEGTFTLTFLRPYTEITDEFAEPIPGLLLEELVLETGCVPVACLDAADCICPFPVDCTLALCNFRTCANIPQEYGDVNRDGVVDLLDIFCVLDGFTGEFDNCTFADVDISGCQADGVIDLLDILEVLDAFAGVQRCSPRCGPP